MGVEQVRVLPSARKEGDVMGKTSRSRATVQIRGVAESSLRAEQKNAFQRGSEPQTLLTQNALREILEAYMCPWCDRGPFKVVTQHTSRMHGIGPKELRDMAGLYYTTTLSAESTLEKRRANGRKRDMSQVRKGRTLGDQSFKHYSAAAKENYGEQRRRKHELSDAAKARNLKQLEAARERGAAAAAAAIRREAEKRFREAEPHIRKAVESQVSYLELARQLGVSTALVGRWAKRMGLPDGRQLAAQWREFPREAVDDGQARDLTEARERDSAEWESSDKSWAKVADMAAARGVSEKSMRGRLRSLGFDLGDGRKRADRKQRDSYPTKRAHCDFEGCDRAHVARGMCQLHYRKWRIETGRAASCSERGCDEPRVARGVCSTHYARLMYGNKARKG